MRPRIRRLLMPRVQASSSSSLPAAQTPPTRAPMDVPVMMSGAIPFATSALMNGSQAPIFCWMVDLEIRTTTQCSRAMVVAVRRSPVIGIGAIR